ncbi:hypothetical protein ACQUJV_24405 [Ralstonia pseudosolanacearum]
MRALFCITVAALVGGCAGHTSYAPPTMHEQVSNSKIIDKPRSAVWAGAIPSLGSRFFTINNMDKESGFINLSYSGDPEAYVDCGTISSSVKNLRGERDYNFPGARAFQHYEVMNNAGLFFLDRSMALEGRVNLVFEEITPTQTRVTANTKYVVTRNLMISNVEGRSQTMTHSVSFNTAGRASFPTGNDGQATACAANGRLERDILANVK